VVDQPSKPKYARSGADNPRQGRMAVSKYVTESQKLREKATLCWRAASRLQEMTKSSKRFAEAKLMLGFELAQRLPSQKDPRMGTIYNTNI